MVKKYKHTEKFYGATTLGEKGQVVIPAGARRVMNLKKGEKLLVFGMGCDMLAVVKLSNIEQIASHFSTKLKTIREIIKNH